MTEKIKEILAQWRKWQQEAEADGAKEVANAWKRATTDLEGATPEEAEEDDESSEEDEQIREILTNSGQLHDGEIEMDADAPVSRGDDNGAYVQTWTWVSFAGTKLDKEAT